VNGVGITYGEEMHEEMARKEDPDADTERQPRGEVKGN